MKKAIYLDERELDLAQRICDFCMAQCQNSLDKTMMHAIDRPAVIWFRDEISNLREKFDMQQKPVKKLTLKDVKK